MYSDIIVDEEPEEVISYIDMTLFSSIDHVHS
jgi:hypothetical protein